MKSDMSIERLKAELKPFYEGLDSVYEGYIQMSDRRIEHLFYPASKLPLWEVLHDKPYNFILEMALFNEEERRSILVRQHNDSWLILDETLHDEMEVESYETVMEGGLKMRMAQKWEAVERTFEKGLTLDVLEPKYLLFAGFEKESK